ncbi:MAG: TadE/TadG family type IV pilus assembly protein [Pseudomonadota bacterium]
MFSWNIRGNFAAMSAILLVPIMGMAGLVVDLTTIYYEKSGLQQVADSAALAGVSELGIAGRTDREIHASIKGFVSSNASASDTASGGSGSLDIEAEISKDRTTLTVDLTYRWSPFFAHYLSGDFMPIKVRSMAKLAQVEPSCVIALNEKGAGQFSMSGKASLHADQCAIHVNSNAADAIKVDKRAQVSGANIYTAGGYKGKSTVFRPMPTTDSPTIIDPLAERAPPSIGKCMSKRSRLTKKKRILRPGTYCGGLEIDDETHVLLYPSIYIIKDGPLTLKGESSLLGRNVGFYFTGEEAIAEIGVESTVKLTAPKSGPMAGILFFEDRKSKPGRKFAIRSKNAQLLEGAIYLQKGKLFVDKESKVGQAAHWTAIIAGEIEIGDGPNIRINTDYAGSEVPVPVGIASSGTARLIQ